jgi:hypothetical protein
MILFYTFVLPVLIPNILMARLEIYILLADLEQILQGVAELPRNYGVIKIVLYMEGIRPPVLQI